MVIELLSQDRHHHGPPPWPGIALKMEYLLPCPQQHLALGHGHRERRSHERGLQMRVSVAVLPGPFVTVVVVPQGSDFNC